VRIYLRHGPKKYVHRFPGCLTVFANDRTIRPFTQSLSRKTGESYTLGAISGQTLGEHWVGADLKFRWPD
jgi:hypothetical protein